MANYHLQGHHGQFLASNTNTLNTVISDVPPLLSILQNPGKA
jgi:hypothetical protein